MIILYIIAASLIVSVISLSGAFFLSVKKEKIQSFLVIFVALAAGTLLGSAFLHIIPESIELSEDNHEVHDEDEHNHISLTSLSILIGILLFYIIEKSIHWHHHHDVHCKHHPVTILSLVGDAIHNFIDGCLIAVAFLVNIPTGIITTLAIALHEIPQEIGDFALLLYGGFSAKKALFWNFISALFSVVGAIAGYIFFSHISEYMPILLGIVAGAFIYIALADILPELQKSKQSKKHTLLTTGMFLLGILLMYALQFFAH